MITCIFPFSYTSTSYIPYPYRRLRADLALSSDSHHSFISHISSRKSPALPRHFPMDHMPLPTDSPLTEQDDVPCLCQDDYHGIPFLSYPKHANRAYVLPDPDQMTYQTYIRVHPMPVEEQDAFYQTWLFFGLLQEVLGKSYRHDDFVRTVQKQSGEVKLVTTSKLLPLLKQWVEKIQDEFRISKDRSLYKHFGECLQRASQVLRVASPGFSINIRFSIAATCEVLANAMNEAFLIEDLVTEGRCPGVWLEFDHTDFELSRMGGNGWCLRQASIAIGRFNSTQTRFFMGKLKKNDPDGRHKQCSRHECKAAVLDLSKYEPKHRDDHCQCEEVVLDGKAVQDILLSGLLPLLYLEFDEPTDSVSPHVVPSSNDVQYVAISHVWADGLGNPHRNALQKCQLLYLQRLLTSLSKTQLEGKGTPKTLFWLDTLCCPISPAEIKAVAIGQMRRTYQEASHVLVLDSSLQQSEGARMGDLETSVRLFTSGWMHRLWTLQEGALAKEIYLQLSDGMVDMRSLWQSTIRLVASKDLWSFGIAGEIFMDHTALRNFFGDHVGESGVTLGVVGAAVQHRSVSVSSDEPLCVGTLLDLDVGALAVTSINERKSRMWSLMSTSGQTIPDTIIFYNGPKLSTKGFRWAPSSLLNVDVQQHIYMRRRVEQIPGTITPEGFKVCFPGFDISAPKPLGGIPSSIKQYFDALLPNDLYLKDNVGKWYVFGYQLRRKQELQAEEPNNPILYNILQNGSNAVIMRTKFVPGFATFNKARQALLVGVDRIEEDIRYVHYDCQVVFEPHRQILCDILNVAFEKAQALQKDPITQELIKTFDPRLDTQSPEHAANLELLDAKVRELNLEALGDTHIAEIVNSLSTNPTEYLDRLILILYMNRYAVMGEHFPETQTWCVD